MGGQAWPEIDDDDDDDDDDDGPWSVGYECLIQERNVEKWGKRQNGKLPG